MILFSLRTASLVPALMAVLWLIGLPGTPTAAADPDLRPVLTRHGEVLDTVSSDAKALEVFSAHIGPALDLLPVVSELASLAADGTTPEAPAMGPASASVRLVAELAAWREATAIKEAAQLSRSPTPLSLSELLKSYNEQRAWLLSGNGRPTLHHATRMGMLLSSIPGPQAEGLDPNPAYATYAADLDRRYSNLTEGAESWLALGDTSGAEGIRQRLLEYWTGPSQGEGAPPAPHLSERERQEFAARYFDSRLRPIFTAYLAALAIRAQAEADQAAREAWADLAGWHQRIKDLRAQARLCGTWQWTVHNHQNHQDHKMMLTFAPPDAQNVAGPRPAKTVVLGDVVFLRWEFPRGYQEDSLIFSNEGQRLEGTFVNSAGAWGSISGKRLASCTPSHSKPKPRRGR